MSLLPEPLRIPAFRYFWLARLSWTIGSLAMVIVIGWQVYDIARHTMGLKEAAFRLGIIGVVQFVPLFLLTLVSGWTADRIDRRLIGREAMQADEGGHRRSDDGTQHHAPMCSGTGLGTTTVTLLPPLMTLWYQASSLPAPPFC